MTGFKRKLLDEILREGRQFYDGVVPDTLVTGVVSDSRQVQPGNIYVALVGGNTDGHRYIAEAMEKGAVAVVGSKLLTEPLPVPYVRVENTRQALADLAAAFYDFPARQMTVVGVTGTDGKTTTANLIYQMLLAGGKRAGIISTVNAVIGDEVLDTGFHVTTPEAPEVQRYLARMLAAGITHVVLETTSHGLDQERVRGCEFDVAVVTNITHEHLDYHQTYEAYRKAKGKLFESLTVAREKAQGNPRLGVLNRDDDSYSYLREVTLTMQVSYGLSIDADYRAEEIRFSPKGVSFRLIAPGGEGLITTRLAGMFNVLNCLAAAAAGMHGLGLTLAEVQKGAAALPGVPGRMEIISLGQEFTVIVDFAHTPNALRRALEATRQMTQGKVWAVFGSAGLRDRQKRRMMAEVSTELADISVFTAEDPRTESLEAILMEMAVGAESKGGVEGKTFFRVPDRGDAIRYAVQHAAAGDLVVVCGKGHEQSMCFGEIEYPWDDRIATRAALCELLGKMGPQMPKLPTSQ